MSNIENEYKMLKIIWAMVIVNLHVWYHDSGVWSDPDLRDLIPDSFDHICTHISQSENPQYLVRASYLEIYQDKISDLLSKVQKEMLELKKRPDTGVYVMVSI